MRLATCHVLEPPTEASLFTLREALLVSVWPSAVVLNAPGAPVENWSDTHVESSRQLPPSPAPHP